MVDGVGGQQRFLVLDALGFGLVLVFILLTQAYIDRTENLLHLLEGVTARYYGSIGAVAAQEIILNACAESLAQASFVGDVELGGEPGGDSLLKHIIKI